MLVSVLTIFYEDGTQNNKVYMKYSHALRGAKRIIRNRQIRCAGKRGVVNSAVKDPLKLYTLTDREGSVVATVQEHIVYSSDSELTPVSGYRLKPRRIKVRGQRNN